MKNLKKCFEGFSIKKLLLCILISTIVSVFVGFTIMFIVEVPSYTMSEIVIGTDENSEIVRDYGNAMQDATESIENSIKELKEKYGEDYPAEGIFLNNILNRFRSLAICKTYTLSLLAGIIIGTLVYIIFLQKAKGLVMFYEIFISGLILLILITLLNYGYSSLVNIGINKIGNPIENSQYQSYVYDIDEKIVIYGFIGVIGISYIVNLIYQNILTKKLNKKLNKTN